MGGCLFICLLICLSFLFESEPGSILPSVGPDAVDDKLHRLEEESHDDGVLVAHQRHEESETSRLGQN